MNGRLVGAFILVLALVAGGAIYYLQIYAFYEELPAQSGLSLVRLADGAAEPFAVSDFAGIDADSSPLRYRACFSESMSLAALSETYQPYDAPTPLVAPGWFDCFDAVAIGEALERGEALAFLSARNIHDGVDRVIAVFPDGRGFAWHQLNEKYQD